MNYHILREIADSWVLLALFLFFAGVVVWAFRPGSRPVHADAANVVFRNDNAPKGECNNSCADCACKSTSSDLGDLS